jgi:transcriptional regulator
MLAAIVGFEFTITKLIGKWKVSQNHPADNRQGVVQGLHATGDAESRQIADMITSLDTVS